MVIEELQNGLSTAIGEVSEFVSEHPIGSAVGAAGVIGAGAGIVALASSGSKKKSKRKTKKKIKHTKRGWKADRARRSKQKWEVAYQRRKHKNKRKHHKRSGRVHYARKTGQPYIILASGKAKFIKGKRKRR